MEVLLRKSFNHRAQEESHRNMLNKEKTIQWQNKSFQQVMLEQMDIHRPQKWI
jgi:hypothetical protein